MIAFTLYSRSYCHLCDDMLEALQTYTADYQFTVKVVDVDTDPDLVALYDEWVPVLVGEKPGQAGHQLCYHVLDHAALSAFFMA